jgi:hypothetical protein
VKKGRAPFITFEADGQWVAYRYFDFTDASASVTIAVRAGQPGGRLELRQGAPDGPLMATLDIPDTGWKWKERKVSVQVDGNPKETIYLVGAKAPFSVKSFRFNR